MRGSRRLGSWALGIIVLGMSVLAIATTGCQANLPVVGAASSDIPEAASPDWQRLRELVARYTGNRGGNDERMILTIQNDFLHLYENHGSDRIGDEALYYHGRISYDLRDYFQARSTFSRHKEQFRRSEFASTILALEAEMDRGDAEYRRWLEESRGASTSVR